MVAVFPAEQARVRALLVQYVKLGAPGLIGAMIIEQTLARADKAIASGDVVEIVHAYSAMESLR